MPKSQKVNAKDSREILLVILQSFSSYILAYMIVYILSGISVLYIAYDFDIPARLEINNIAFNISFESVLWTKDAIVSVFMAQAVSSFIMATISVLLLLLLKPKHYWVQLFHIWFLLHGFNFTFGMLGEDIILQRGLFRVAAVLELRQAMLILTIGISVFFLLKAGTLAGKLFYSKVYQLNSSSNNSKTTNFLIAIFIPYLIGAFTILLLSYAKNSLKDILLSLSMLVCLMPVIFAKVNHNTISATRTKPKIKQTFFILSLVIVAVFLFYILLNNGISLGSFST